MANEHNLKRRKLIGAIFGNLEVIPFNPEVDPEPFTCYNCWSDKHFRRDCSEPVTHAYCHNCGRRDVEVQDCPRCAKAYREFLDDWRGKEQEMRRLSAALYDSKQFVEADYLCPVDSPRERSKKKCKQDCDFEVKNMSTKSLMSEKRTVWTSVDECWTDSDDDVYQSVQAISFARNDSESVAKNKGVHDCHSELYKSVQGSFVAWNESIISAADDIEECEGEFCSDGTGDTDYESTRAEFIREYCDSENAEEFEETSSESLSLSFNDEYHSLSESFQANRDADLNELFAYIRNKKSKDQLASNSVNRVKSIAKSKSVHCFVEMEDDMDYDDVIVDENERSESLCSKDYAIQEFLDLLDAVKHLSIEIQNIAVLHFVSERKKQCRQNQEKMLHQYEDACSEFS